MNGITVMDMSLLPVMSLIIFVFVVFTVVLVEPAGVLYWFTELCRYTGLRVLAPVM